MTPKTQRKSVSDQSRNLSAGRRAARHFEKQRREISDAEFNAASPGCISGRSDPVSALRLLSRTRIRLWRMAQASGFSEVAGFRILNRLYVQRRDA